MKVCVGSIVKLTSVNYIDRLLPSSRNVYLDSNSYHKIKSLRGNQTINGNCITSWYIVSQMYPDHETGWVYEHEIVGARVNSTLDVLEERLLELNKEAQEVKAKIEWMKLSGLDEYNDDQYKIYQTLKLIEDSEKGTIEKSKIITDLIGKKC